MRKIFTILSFAALSAVNAQYDGFNYTTPLTDNGWFGSTNILPLTTPSDKGNSLSFEGIPESVGNRVELIPTNGNIAVNKSFAESSTTVVYTSFLMKITETSKLSSNTTTSSPGGYFFHFSPDKETIGSTGIVSRVGARLGKLPNTYNIALTSTTGAGLTEADIYGPNPKDYNVGQTYFVVVKYDMTGTVGEASIWINTLSESEVTHSTNFGTSKQAQISSLILRQRNTGPSVELDEVRYGTTWKSVTEGTLSTGEVNNKAKNILSNTLVVDQFKVLSNQKTSVEVYSLTGQLVKTVQVAPQNAVNISNLPSGVYIVKIVEGNQTYTQKIVKK